MAGKVKASYLVRVVLREPEDHGEAVVADPPTVARLGEIVEKALALETGPEGDKLALEASASAERLDV